jgi:hypothetical protein
METPLQETLGILQRTAQALNTIYWTELQENRPPSFKYREALKRLRMRIYNLQKSLGVIA